MKTNFTIKMLPVILLIMGLPLLVSAQQSKQTVRGKLTDKVSETPLEGAIIMLVDTTYNLGAVADAEGKFVIENVPVGRRAFKVSYVGYKGITVPNVQITSGKEVVLDVALEESVLEMQEAVITAKTNKDKAENEMAALSARSFSLEEVTRYSGTRNDASRMVANFAGVSTPDDSRNDIVIRGNSPAGLLWRLEGIAIPSPNHYATLGTTGGPVSALNTNLLKNSDFLTSAFPAEYGNATSGVFDVKLRNGNENKHEGTLQLNMFSGLEAMAEGPMNKKHNSSYLASYRYSFAGIGAALGLPIGTNAAPQYQDLTFKLNLPNSKAGKFSIFGLAGISNIKFLHNKIDANDLFADPSKDSYAKSRLGIIGVKHTFMLDDKSSINTVVSFSTAHSLFDQDDILADNTKYKTVEVRDRTYNYAITTAYQRKVNRKFNFKTGVVAQVFQLDVFNKSRTQTAPWVVNRDFAGALGLVQVYFQSKYRFTDNLALNTGVNAGMLTYNTTWYIDPRVSLSWDVAPAHTLSLGYGLHSQMQPLPVYLFTTPNLEGGNEETNKNLDFTRSHHAVLAYDSRFAKDWRLKAEFYFQYLHGVPVDKFSSSFSMLNAGNDFAFPDRANLTNRGTGYNYGMEITVEKFFSKGYYILFTGSLFNSKYKGSDGKERNTAFNNNYITNVLGGKEFRVGKDKRHALTIDTRFSLAGGRYYTPVDEAASQAAFTEILDEQQAFTQKLPLYYRWDVKLGFQLNSKKRKISNQFYIDFQNVTNHKNVFARRYNPVTNSVGTTYQIGFFPDVMYRLQF